MDQSINLNLYKVFYFAATNQSFKAAAKDLCVSQPAISKQIKLLENLLDVKLFYRFNKGIELTNEGQLLLVQVEKMNFYLEASIKYIASAKKLLIGDLSIGCPAHITSFYLLSYLERFRNDYPNINIQMISDSTSSLIEMLNHHKIDFIIDSYPIHFKSKDFILKKLGVFEMIFIVSSNYKDSITKISDLNNKNLILPLPRSSIRISLEEYLLKNNINYSVGLSFETTDLIISAVKKNLGIGYVVKESVIEEIAEKKIEPIELNFDLPRMELGIVYIKDYLSSPAEEFIRKYIKLI